jgi:hypothetical protein
VQVAVAVNEDDQEKDKDKDEERTAARLADTHAKSRVASLGAGAGSLRR